MIYWRKRRKEEKKEEEKGEKTRRETETRGDHWVRRREDSWESLLLVLAMTDKHDRNDPRGRLRVPIDCVTLRRRRETRGGGTRRTLDGTTARRLVVGTRGGFYGR